MHYYVLIGLFIFLFFCQKTQENYTNTQLYERNKPNPNEPDTKQFYACRQDLEKPSDYLFKGYPNSNFRVKENVIKAPLNGTFSAFLDVHKIRSYDAFYHAPICEDDNESYDFNTDISSQFRLIPGAFPEEDINKIYEEEIEKDSYDLRNPYYSYSDPEYIKNKILYNDKIQDIFLRVKMELPKHHEDNRHLLGVKHPYGNDYDPE